MAVVVNRLSRANVAFLMGRIQANHPNLFDYNHENYKSPLHKTISFNTLRAELLNEENIIIEDEILRRQWTYWKNKFVRLYRQWREDELLDLLPSFAFLRQFTAREAGLHPHQYHQLIMRYEEELERMQEDIDRTNNIEVQLFDLRSELVNAQAQIEELQIANQQLRDRQQIAVALLLP